MKQLCVTSCLPGRSVNGSSGFQIRAVSPGLSDPEQQMLRRQAGYALPKGYPQETPPADAPVRFSFLKLDNGKRVLLRAGYLGQDPTTQRYNNYFAHVITDLPDKFTAADAARAWEGPFWLRRDFDGNMAELKTMSDGPLTPQRIAEFARKQQDLVKFVLTMLVFGPKDTRIRIVADSEQVALCVACAAQCLPLSLREELTFSTYEFDPDTSFARIVGTCWHKSSPHDLSTLAFQPNGGGYNTFTGKKAPLTVASPFVDAVVETVANQRLQDLDAFFRFWNELQVNDFALLDLAFRVFTGKTLSSADLQKCAATPALLQHWVMKPGHHEELLTLAYQDQTIREKVLPLAATLLRTHQPQVHASLKGQIWQAGLNAWRGKSQDALQVGRVYIEDMFAKIDDSKTPLWESILAQLTQPATLAWPVREYLLKKFIAAKFTPRTHVAWLCDAPEHLPRLLKAIEASEECRKVATLECVSKYGSAKTIDALGAGSDQAWDALVVLAKEPSERADPLEFWQGLMNVQQARTRTLERTMKLLPQQKKFVEACLSKGLSGPIEPLDFLKTHVSKLSDPFRTTAALQCVKQIKNADDAVQALGVGSALAWDVVLALARDDKKSALDLWLELLKRQHPRLVESTLGLPSQQKEFVENCMANGIALGKNGVDPLWLLRTQYVRVQQFSSPVLLRGLTDAAANECLKTDPWHEEALAFLSDRKGELPENDTGRAIRGLIEIHAFCAKPARTRLTAAAEALRLISEKKPPMSADMKRKIKDKIKDSLCVLLLDVAKKEPNEVLPLLESLSLAFVSESSPTLLDQVWDQLHTNNETWQQPTLVSAFVALFFGQAKAPGLKKLRKQGPAATELLALVDQHAPALLESINTSAKHWEKPGHDDWRDAYEQLLKSKASSKTKGDDMGWPMQALAVGVTCIVAVVLWEFIRPFVEPLVHWIQAFLNRLPPPR